MQKLTNMAALSLQVGSFVFLYVTREKVDILFVLFLFEKERLIMHYQ